MDYIFVAQIPNLTVEIIFIVDVGQLKLTKLAATYFLVYTCNSRTFREKAKLHFRVESLCLSLYEIGMAFIWEGVQMLLFQG